MPSRSRRLPLVASSLTLLVGVGIGAGLSAVAPQVLDPIADAAPSAAVDNAAALTVGGGSATLDYDPSVSLAPLVEELGPAVVHLKVSQEVDLQSMVPRQMLPFLDIDPEQLKRMQQGEGSGFLISEDGYILTNNHVVADADEVTVILADEREFTATVVGTDPRTDVALVKIEDEGGFPTVPLGSSEGARVGDRVVAIGNPFGLEHTVTTGIISAKGRVIGAGPYDDFLQTDASINPGNSGGPLFNLKGEVVGINTAINPRAQGIGFSVPIDMVKDIIEELKEDGRVARGWIGVGLRAVDGELADRLDLDLDDGEGVMIGAVYQGTPGAEAGLEPGDVVLELEGEVLDDTEGFIRAVGDRRPGDKIELLVLRDGRKKRLDVRLAERPEEDDLRRGRFLQPEAEPESAGPDASAVSDLGIRVRAASEVRGYGGSGGVVVTRIASGSRAEKGLRPGDRILECNGKTVDSEKDLARALREDGAIVMVVDRRGTQLLVEL
jgi:serine protease Do